MTDYPDLGIKEINMLEISIKMFNVNRDNDMVFYMVLDSLATEQVYLPFNDAGNLTSLQIGGQDIIPVFSRENGISEEEPVHLRACYIKDYVNLLLMAGKNIYANPFSEEDIRFFFPYECIEKMLIPVIAKNGG